MQTSFADIVESIQNLDTEAKRELLDLIQTWLIEERRQEIARNADTARAEHAQGKLKSGSIDELMADLHGED